MSVREGIGKRKTLSIILALGMIAVAGVVMAHDFWPQHRPSGKYACYSDDDGQSFFVDAANKVVPFDHDGKQADRAFVFSYDNGHKTFIVCLMRYTDKGKTRLQQAMDDAGKKNIPVTAMPQFDDQSLQEVKLPGPGNPWVLRANPESLKVMKIQSPDGSAVDMVIP